MKQTKKPTYKELERDNHLLIIFWVVLFLLFLVIYLGLSDFNNNLRLENEELKSQLNQTEGENYSCDFVGAIKPEDTRICENETIRDEIVKSVWKDNKEVNFTKYVCSKSNLTTNLKSNFLFTVEERITCEVIE